MTDFRTAKDLPPYDPDATCPPCGSRAVDTVYHPMWQSDRKNHLPVWPCQEPPVRDEHLCRVCTRCGYKWCEAPANARPSPEEEAARINRMRSNLE